MTYIVNESCIKCKYTDCVEVCEPECPPEAILPDTEPAAEKWLAMNAEYAEIWPNITRKIDAMPDADKLQEEAGKYEKYFSANPGEGS